MLRSIGAHSELIVRPTGVNVVATSCAYSALRHFDDSCGGPITPPVSVRLTIRHSPGWISLANAAEAAKTSNPDRATR
jgi:hypothetical protein